MNKFTTLLVTFLMLFNLITFAEDYDMAPKPEPTPIPALKLASDAMISLKANTEQTVDVSIKNITSFYAYNILVSAKITGDDVPFKVEFADKSNIKHSLQQTGVMNLKLFFDVDKNAKPGTYELVLNYSFTSKDKTNYTGSDTLLIKIENDEMTPTVILSDFTYTPKAIKAGENIKIGAKIENIGKTDAKDVTISVNDLPEGIGLSESSNTISFKDFNADYKNNISFNFVTNKTLKNGSYPVKFELSYKDSKLNENKKQYLNYINVTGEVISNEDAPKIEIISAKSPENISAVGQKADILLTLKNTGNKQAKNIKITATVPENGAVVPYSASIVQIPTLNKDEQKVCTFSFSPTASSSTQNYAIGFLVEYETGNTNDDGTNEKISFEQYVGMNVSNPEGDKGKDGEDEKTSKPKIIISKYVSDPMIVQAGEKFRLDMVFKNTHLTKTVHNIKLYLTVDEKTEEKGNVFSPDNSSNTFYIDSIPPKGEVSHSFNMFTVPDAQARTYTIQVNFEYEDKDANEYTSTELVGINVRQSSVLETSDIAVPTEGFVGEPVYVGFEIFNLGKSTINNLMVKAEGDFDTQGSSLFVGNLDSGSSEYYEGSFMPTEAGEKSGKIIISYDDTDGSHIEKVTDFTINVSEPVIEDEPVMDTELEKTPIYKNKYLYICVGVLALIIAAVVIIIKRRKKGNDIDE